MSELSIRLGSPRWCVVRSYWDRSGVIAVYGPVDTQEEAAQLCADLGSSGLGLSDQLEAIPFNEIRALP